MRLVFATLLLCGVLLCATAAGSQQTYKPGAVVILTDENFDNITSTGKWMVNLFSPRCHHCRTLEPIWELLAREAADENLGFQVAKADVTTAHILRNRFGVTGVPVVYLLKDGDAWQYDGERSVQAFRDFAVKGYRSASPLSYFKAPNSSFGRAYGAAVAFWYRVPVVLHKVYTHLKEEHRMSDLAIFASLLTIPVTFGLGVICALDAYYTRRSLHHPHMD